MNNFIRSSFEYNNCNVLKKYNRENTIINDKDNQELGVKLFLDLIK